MSSSTPDPRRDTAVPRTSPAEPAGPVSSPPATGDAAAPAPAADPAPATDPDDIADPDDAAMAEGPAAPRPGPGGTAPEEGPLYRVADVVDPETVRHAPRFGRFVLLGVVLGALLALALAVLTPPSDLARSDLFWLLFLGLGVTGGMAGLGVAVVLDRRSWRRRAAAGGHDAPTPDVPTPDVPIPDVPIPDVPIPDVAGPDVPAPGEAPPPARS
ncbi:hypothetical protein [Georgenia yuyongxinii]